MPREYGQGFLNVLAYQDQKKANALAGQRQSMLDTAKQEQQQFENVLATQKQDLAIGEQENVLKQQQQQQQVQLAQRIKAAPPEQQAALFDLANREFFGGSLPQYGEGGSQLVDQYAMLGEPGAEEVPTVGQRDFTSMTEDFSQEDTVTARRIKAGLDPRAVGSSSQTTALTPGLSDIVAQSEANIAGKKKFAEMQGSQRSQAIDKGFDKVTKLEQNLVNLDNAIDAVKAGAGTGAITKRFPSIKQSSVLLDQVQGALALDVIGSVTFGALSEGELNLAKEIAIPTGLEGPELIKWLQDKKAAQTKLLDYYKEQIDFLDNGGSVAGFLRSKKRGTGQAVVQPGAQDQPQVIKFDAQGNIIR